MKCFITATVVSLIAASAFAGGMPEELIEPTKIAIVRVAILFRHNIGASPSIIQISNMKMKMKA